MNVLTKYTSFDLDAVKKKTPFFHRISEMCVSSWLRCQEGSLRAENELYFVNQLTQQAKERKVFFSFIFFGGVTRCCLGAIRL